MNKLKEKLETITDTRHEGYVKHPLVNILIIVMCATLCGIDSLCGIVQYADEKKSFFEKHFKINKIPSKPTFCRVLRMISGE